ncbi:protein FAM185A [Alosa sapidissima]|uniref:protein FAM185A n=1 Tax=Alosa sapidissima TaxID=34773 RepID=UPI001C095C33|nr:protein FAM185A [Alosa sapidissima]
MHSVALSTRICLGALRFINKGYFHFGCALPSTVVRSLSTAPLLKDINQPLKQWSLEVSPFSKVNVKIRCDLSVCPLDPHAFPEADRAFISVHGTNADHEFKLDDLHVHYSDQSQELLIHGDKVTSNVTVELTAPIKSDLFITTSGGGNVNIQKMESDVCKVQTETGNCTLTSIRSHKVDVLSAGGNIIGFGTIHGNVDVCAKEGSEVNIKKIQGSFMNVSTEQGQLKVKAIYAESSKVSSSSGEIQLGHIHGDASVQSGTGNVNIDNSNGALRILTTSGNIDTYVGERGSADLMTQQGSVSVRVPASMKAEVQLSGASVKISSDIMLHEGQHESRDSNTTVTGTLNGPSAGEQWIKVEAKKGSISLRPQSWFESLRLEK